MSNITKTRAAYFDGHPKSNELFFTSNGLCYFNQGAADNAIAGKKGVTVDKITRAEVVAWRAEQSAPPVEVPVTNDMIAADDTLAARGVKPGDVLVETKADVDAVAAAQKVYDDTVAAGDATMIPIAKQALSNAKRKATLEAKKK